MPRYFLRIGALAEVRVGQTGTELSRGRRVIVRTDRGVELAEVAGPCERASRSSDGSLTILRPTTDSDELLIRRLDQHKREAVEACRDQLAKARSEAVLLDVDQLFDGGTLVMHFLGAVDAVAESITREIAERYESIVRTRELGLLLDSGCGPDCGTKVGGCAGGCAGCGVAAACQTSSGAGDPAA